MSHLHMVQRSCTGIVHRSSNLLLNAWPFDVEYRLKYRAGLRARAFALLDLVAGVVERVGPDPVVGGAVASARDVARHVPVTIGVKTVRSRPGPRQLVG
jgi:hypothetical protein